jgi:hypothetical protein
VRGVRELEGQLVLCAFHRAQVGVQLADPAAEDPGFLDQGAGILALPLGRRDLLGEAVPAGLQLFGFPQDPKAVGIVLEEAVERDLRPAGAQGVADDLGPLP